MLKSTNERLDSLNDRLDRIEERLAMNVVKEAYTTEEGAERLGRSHWTVRQWCNKGQVPGAKKVRGKGRTGEWRIPHEVLVKLQAEGPGPLPGQVKKLLELQTAS